MGRRWVPVLIVVVGFALGLAVAGIPSRGKDAPLEVRAQQATTTSTPAPTSTAVAVASASAPTTASPAVAARAPGDVRVTVVNASGVPGSATRIGATITSQGWNVESPGADRKTQQDSAVMYRPGYADEARALAGVLGLGADQVAPMDAAVFSPAATDLGVLVGTALAKRTG